MAMAAQWAVRSSKENGRRLPTTTGPRPSKQSSHLTFGPASRSDPLLRPGCHRRFPRFHVLSSSDPAEGRHPQPQRRAPQAAALQGNRQQGAVASRAGPWLAKFKIISFDFFLFLNLSFKFGRIFLHVFKILCFKHYSVCKSLFKTFWPDGRPVASG